MASRNGPRDAAPAVLPPLAPHVVVLFGAAGDLAKRKLLPGLFHLSGAGLIPDCRIIGTSLEELDDEAFRELARAACEEFGRKVDDPAALDVFLEKLSYVPTG
ncbi:MAG TPA: glucose-6-phosphate dehydrogenase, partial [Solirubrobacterales bacterium]|nr:glucose-6-phosphate dehydrogenase [Solirubrobacterales bacterium]